MSNHVRQTVGGMLGHVFRRFVHVAIAVVPILYYFYGVPIAQVVRLTPPQLLIAVIIFNIIFESVRLKFGWTWIGYRRHERKRISSFAWGVLSIGLVLLLAPDQRFGIPIIWSCALGDPLLGELRNTRLSNTWIAALGIVFVMAIWFFCTGWLGTPWRLALLMGPLMVGLEWPNIRWIDDNALMQLVPLLIVLILYG